MGKVLLRIQWTFEFEFESFEQATRRFEKNFDLRGKFASDVFELTVRPVNVISCYEYLQKFLVSYLPNINTATCWFEAATLQL